MLLRNGYKQKAKDRFIRPGSESKAPGAAIMRNCADGIERVYSHAGDVLNDGYSHDAFDCMRLLEHGGDWNKALAWNPEITKHNQRLYMQEQVKNAPESPPRNDQHQEQAEPKEKPLFPLIRSSELTAKPAPIDWLLEDIIEWNSLNLLFGEPGAGKSLFALDWAFCMAAGIDWHERRTKQTDVVVIAGEGHAGMKRRLRALEIKYGMKASDRLFISKCPADFMDSQNIAWVADTIKATCSHPGLVIIDTLHRNMTGDENSSKDIGQFISNIDQLLRPLGCAVLIVHHSGHGPKDRSRGSSSIRAAMDGEFSAVKDERGGSGIVALACHKSKDFESFKPIAFSLHSTDLGDDWLDNDGEHLTSVYLKYIGDAKHDKASRKISPRDDAILTSLWDAITEHGVEPTAEIKMKYGGFDGLMGMEKDSPYRPLARKGIQTARCRNAGCRNGGCQTESRGQTESVRAVPEKTIRSGQGGHSR
ncbi:MAG: AAA family ATPase [Methylobacter sp.]